MSAYEVAVISRTTGAVTASLTAIGGDELETAALYLEAEYRALLSGAPPSHLLTIYRIAPTREALT